VSVTLIGFSAIAIVCLSYFLSKHIDRLSVPSRQSLEATLEIICKSI
jgi:hypothetical protein